MAGWQHFWMSGGYGPSWRIDLDWDDNTEPDLDHYNVYRSSTSGGSYTLIGSPTASFYSDTNVDAGETWWYKVSAVDTGGGESALSAPVSATATAGDPMSARSAPRVSTRGGGTLKLPTTSAARPRGTASAGGS